MATAKYDVIDFAVDDPSTIKNKIANNSLITQRTGAAYQAYANSPAAMNVKIAAGAMLVAGALIENAIATSGTITAPSVNPRIDRVVLDIVTGLASIIAGVEAVSPVPPAIPNGKLPIAQIALATSTTVIGNSLITDERTQTIGRSIPNLDLERAVRRGRHFAALNLV